jgi:hypothetical protein
MSAWAAQHRKLIAAVAGAVVTVVVQVWGTGAPWVTALILIATAAGVYRAPNEPQPAPAVPALPSVAGGGGTRPVRVIAGHGTGQPGAAEPAAGAGGFPPSAFPS